MLQYMDQSSFVCVVKIIAFLGEAHSINERHEIKCKNNISAFI